MLIWFWSSHFFDGMFPIILYLIVISSTVFKHSLALVPMIKMSSGQFPDFIDLICCHHQKMHIIIIPWLKKANRVHLSIVASNLKYSKVWHGQSPLFNVTVTSLQFNVQFKTVMPLVGWTPFFHLHFFRVYVTPVIIWFVYLLFLWRYKLLKSIIDLTIAIHIQIFHFFIQIAIKTRNLPTIPNQTHL